MIKMDFTLIGVGLAGIMILFVVFSKRFGWYGRKHDSVQAKEAAASAPFWLGLITVLSLAAIVFSIHALLVVHGVLR